MAIQVFFESTTPLLHLLGCLKTLGRGKGALYLAFGAYVSSQVSASAGRAEWVSVLAPLQAFLAALQGVGIRPTLSSSDPLRGPPRLLNPKLGPHLLCSIALHCKAAPCQIGFAHCKTDGRKGLLRDAMLGIPRKRQSAGDMQGGW